MAAPDELSRLALPAFLRLLRREGALVVAGIAAATGADPAGACGSG